MNTNKIIAKMVISNMTIAVIGGVVIGVIEAIANKKD
jgi:hypothetical protein